MNGSEILYIAERRKKQCVLMDEFIDLTRQTIDAAERRDQISVRMFISMRQDALKSLAEIDRQLDNYLSQLPEENARRAWQLLNGAEPREGEEPAARETARFKRLHERATQLDRTLSVKLSGKKSFYVKFNK